MITASQKKRDNIAEYLLYMWQIEDLIRANGLDIDKIRANIIDKYSALTPAQRKEMEEWYESLIDMMRREDVAEKGHLQLNKNVIIALDDLCRRLLATPKYSAFSNLYYATLPYIVELRAKAGEEKPGEIEACFNALYGVLMLRLHGREVNEQTKTAVADIGKFLATLSMYYKQDFNNELEL